VSDPRLDRILRSLIFRSFPTLRRCSVLVQWDVEDDWMCYSVEGRQCTITVSDCLKEASRRVLEGGLAHELCHVEADLRVHGYCRDVAWDRYAESRWYRMREERTVEERVVELGYGPQLLSLIHFIRRSGYRVSRQHGLTRGEIVRLLRTAARDW